MYGLQKNGGWYCVEEESAEQSLYLKAPGLCDSSVDTKLLPRIGDQYQAKIPPLLSKSSYLKLAEFPTDSIILPETPHSPVTGLPIKFMWSAESHSSSNDMLNGNVAAPESCTAKSEMHQLCGVKMQLLHSSLMDSWIEIEEAAFLLGLYTFGKNFVQVKKFVEGKTMEDIQSYYYGKFYRSARYWRWSERCKVRSRRCIVGQKIYTGLRQRKLLSRLLLHVPEESKKTLLEVAKTFEEGKMILEEFVFTLKVIVGLNVLVEAVGIGKEGKQDLTGNVKEPSKSKQPASLCPEIPKGRAWSSLTPLEIVNFLTGGYRLSKARSDDIFWEAVWPRLLAKGWHSEQPRDYLMTANRHSLVFLIPGVKKFSRKILVKGNHYFDSVADVLNKVASDPVLLELDIGADIGADKKEENSQINETSPKGDFYQQCHNYLKPQSPVPGTDSIRFTVVDTSLTNGGTKKVRDLRSLPVGMKNISAPHSESEESDEDSAEDATNDSGCNHDSQSEMIESGTSRTTKNNLRKGFLGVPEILQDDAPKCCSTTDSSSFTRIHVKVQKGNKNGCSRELQPRKAVKSQAIQRINLRSRKFRTPLEHRLQSLNSFGQLVPSCGTKDTLVSGSLYQEKAPPEQQLQLLMSCGGVVPCYGRKDALVIPSLDHEKLPPLEQQLQSIISGGRLVPSCGTKDPLVSPSSSPEMVGKPEFGAYLSINEDRHEDKLSSTSFSSQVGLDGFNKHPLRSNFPAAERPCQKPRFFSLFDLNTLPAPEDAEDETSLMEIERPHLEIRRQLEDSSSQSESVTVCNNSSDQPPKLNSRRRHSTRNGPPTAKALEAFAAGFYSSTHKRKRKAHFQPLENVMSKCSRHPQNDRTPQNNNHMSVANYSSHIEETPIFS